MVRVYRDGLVGAVPLFPREMENRIDAYLAAPAGPEAAGPIAEHRPARWMAAQQSISGLPPRRLQWNGERDQ